MPDPSIPPELQAAWEAARKRLRRSVPEPTFRMWLEPLSPAGLVAETVYLSAPEKIRAWVAKRYASLLADALSDALDRPVLISLDPIDPDRAGTPARTSPQLNPAYTFERFVIGEGNHLAHAAALSVAEAPAEAYNPLFLHGPPGLGKTHLLCAIANYLAINAPGLTVRYTTAESFTGEFVFALKNSGIEAFKARYRDLDVLLVDDIQFLEGKQNTEEEFFHTFNALYEGGSQLVMSADRMPSELSTLAGRLRDRFEWGLIVPVDRPTYATRETVLKRLAREAGLELPDRSALEALATAVDSNIRQLHGALTRLIAHASLTSRPLDASLVEDVIGTSQSPAPASLPNSITTEDLQERVAAVHGLQGQDLRGSSRSAGTVRARQMAILLTREMTDLSLPDIGRRFGGRDHSTIHNSVRRARALVESDSEFSSQVNSLRRSFHSDAGPLSQ